MCYHQDVEITVTVDDEFEGLVNTGCIIQAARQALEAEYPGRDLQVGILVTGDDEMQKLNYRYRGKNEPTDILSFSLSENAGGDQPDFIPAPGQPQILGEMAISYPRAVSQALELNHTLERELAILVVHGVLHLAGYDHCDEQSAEEMEGKEAAILEMIGEERA